LRAIADCDTNFVGNSSYFRDCDLVDTEILGIEVDGASGHNQPRDPIDGSLSHASDATILSRRNICRYGLATKVEP